MFSKERQKFIKSLHNKKNRQEEGLFLVEGAKSLEEVLLSDFEIDTLCISEKFLDKYPSLMENREFVLCNPSDIQNMSTLKSNDMWVAVVKQKQNLLSEIDDSKYCLVLDTINDPGNMGTILRIADWYWIDQVVCNSVTVELYNPKVIMSSMGSFTRVKVISCDLGEYLTNTKLPIYWAFLEWENVHTASFAPVANIVIWNESHGISQEIEKFITDKITIPRFWKAESLNAWVATWVILDNILRNISN